MARRSGDGSIKYGAMEAKYKAASSEMEEIQKLHNSSVEGHSEMRTPR